MQVLTHQNRYKQISPKRNLENVGHKTKKVRTLQPHLGSEMFIMFTNKETQAD